MVPSIEQCYAFMEKYEMLENIRAHSIMVERVAALIAQGLREVGVDVSLEMTTAGALMHDIAKTRCLETGENHAALGQRICLDNQLGEIADIVGQHVKLTSYDPDGDILEREIVYYADKRVNHDVIVSLEERREYLLDRYGRDQAFIRDKISINMTLAKEVEKKLFARLPFGPMEMDGQITQDRSKSGVNGFGNMKHSPPSWG